MAVGSGAKQIFDAIVDPSAAQNAVALWVAVKEPEATDLLLKTPPELLPSLSSHRLRARQRQPPPLTRGYGQHHAIERLDRKRRRDAEIEEREKLETEYLQTIEVLFWNEKKVAPKSFGVIGTASAANPTMLFIVLHGFKPFEDELKGNTSIAVLKNSRWMIQDIKLSIPAFRQQHVLVRLPNLDDSDCLGLDQFLPFKTISTTRAIERQPKKELPTPAISQLPVSTIQALAEKANSQSASLPVVHAGKTILLAPGPIPSRLPSVPAHGVFPPRYSCDIVPGLQALASTKEGPERVQVFNEHFPNSLYVRSTVSKHIRFFRVARLHDLYENSVKAGRTDAGLWSHVRKAAEKKSKDSDFKLPYGEKDWERKKNTVIDLADSSSSNDTDTDTTSESDSDDNPTDTRVMAPNAGATSSSAIDLTSDSESNTPKTDPPNPSDPDGPGQHDSSSSDESDEDSPLSSYQRVRFFTEIISIDTEVDEVAGRTHPKDFREGWLNSDPFKTGHLRSVRMFHLSDPPPVPSKTNPWFDFTNDPTTHYVLKRITHPGDGTRAWWDGPLVDQPSLIHALMREAGRFARMRDALDVFKSTLDQALLSSFALISHPVYLFHIHERYENTYLAQPMAPDNGQLHRHVVGGTAQTFPVLDRMLESFSHFTLHHTNGRMVHTAFEGFVYKTEPETFIIVDFTTHTVQNDDCADAFIENCAGIGIGNFKLGHSCNEFCCALALERL
ncbi:hypothetical protein CC1G_10322 [Coprinopsis cinerea okayama7|uniref:Alpha-type protein kinase domain-containing protein n=1 Tax=Coprinopsis cinerea (strain Okayama-7 / 130 / ATCC MYA-4618 / FGSC 9003) TaxID=240176 RepID=A8P0I9_COPC7|nr:hypothetical protein CC1G_10322 [Coprinopsis cinerea okayama7\|eukprot:XP_001837901.2 hypothetical protein CC1G_10322 [Coprinopsis cinerea okayama7\